MPQSAITLMVYEGLLQWFASGGGGGGGAQQAPRAGVSSAGAGRQQQQQEVLVDREQPQGARGGQQRGRQRAALTDKMQPLVIAADSQAEQ